VKRKNSATAIIATEKTFSITHFFNISNDAGAVKDWVSCFSKSGHTSANSGMRTEFLFDDLFIQLQGSGRFLSSLRWRNPPDISSVTFDHDVLFKLPSLWGDG